MILQNANVELRLARPAEASAVAALLLESFAAYKSLYTDAAFRATTLDVSKIKDRIRDKRIWLAFDKAEMMATISLFPVENVMYIKSVAVKPGVRRRGLGRELIKHAIKEAMNGRMHVLELTTTAFLFEALRLYEGLGFESYGYDDLYGTQLIKMRKVLETTNAGLYAKKSRLKNSQLKTDKVEIRNCSSVDVDAILSLYDAAVQLQTQKKMVVWPKFERSLVEREIEEGRQWKLMVNGKIACNWAVTFNDKDIWEEKDNDDSIYIHRIATNPAFRGNRFVDTIVDWATDYAIAKGKQYVRLDTLGNNTGLIKHYTSAGFNFLGIFKLKNTQNLPAHYQREPNCCLFEIALTPILQGHE